MFFDTHAHYDDKRFDGDRDALLGAMRESGVSLILNAGSSVESSRRGLALADKYPFIYAAVGVHPHDAMRMDEGSVPEMRCLLKHPKAAAVGEIGLDYHYNFSPPDVQKSRFREQLELARELGASVIIHEREAFEDVMNILSDYRGVRGVFHCFSGGWDAAKRVLDMGDKNWMLSFTGVITFKSARAALETAARVPLDRLMLETDAPYLSPEPARGGRNDSRNLSHIARCLAAARGIGTETLAEAALLNGKKFFGIP
ncbi:MAG: TatD family hydrolase [Oscillospiraceae bacterium]|jgi:TatD DNase family protein|nr:TatD family hydrolase [Oscillospiraceae bacterium]